LAISSGGDEDDEMLEAGLCKSAIELEPGCMVGKPAIGAFAEPCRKAALFGNGGKSKVLFTGAQRELLAIGFPTELLDKKFGEIAMLQQRAGA
jgi:hypothetical protein